MSTRNQLDLQTPRSQPIPSKNLRDHWFPEFDPGIIFRPLTCECRVCKISVEASTKACTPGFDQASG
jgi:hypothetical protein